MNIPVFSKAWGSCTDRVNGQEIATLNCGPVVLTNIINALLGFAGVVAVILIIWGGIKYTTARGDPQAIDSARKTITWAIIGLVFVLSSFAILQFIKTLTGVNF